MAKESYLVGLDVGSANVRVVVASLPAGENNLPAVRGVATQVMDGIQKGVINDVDAAAGSISKVLDGVERMAGVPVERAYVSINGSHLMSQNSRGVIAVSRADGEITPDDVDRVVNAAQAISLPANREIVHVLPQHFIVDGQEQIKDPVGMTGVRLEVEAHIIEGSAPFIKNLTKAVNQAGVHIEDFVFPPLASSRAVLDKKQKDLGVAVVDLGAGTTSMAVYEENMLLHTAVLPFGASHITNDIAIGLRTSIEAAEIVKINHGTAVSDDIKKSETILIEGDDDESVSVSRHEVVNIISARLDEIMSFVNRELTNINRAGLLPSGVVFTGGGAHLPGVVEVAKKSLKLPARIGRPAAWEGLADQLEDPALAVAQGLIVWALEQEHKPSSRMNIGVPDIGHSVGKLRGWLKTFMP